MPPIFIDKILSIWQCRILTERFYFKDISKKARSLILFVALEISFSRDINNIVHLAIYTDVSDIYPLLYLPRCCLGHCQNISNVYTKMNNLIAWISFYISESRIGEVFDMISLGIVDVRVCLTYFPIMFAECYIVICRQFFLSE